MAVISVPLAISGRARSQAISSAEPANSACADRPRRHIRKRRRQGACRRDGKSAWQRAASKIPAGRRARAASKNAILIAGPTASGKSALALDLAERHGGVIVNTDSMQGYSVLERADGAADRCRTRPRAALSLRPCPPVDCLFDRRLAARCDAADRRAARFRRDRRSSSAAPGSISARLQRAFRKCPTFRSRSAIAGATNSTEQGRGQAAPHPAARGSASRHEAEADRRPAHRAGAGGA